MHPSSGHHVEEDEGKDEETQHGTDDAGVARHPADADTVQRRGIPHGPGQHQLLKSGQCDVPSPPKDKTFFEMCMRAGIGESII